MMTMTMTMTTMMMMVVVVLMMLTSRTELTEFFSPEDDPQRD
jgi:hypothetical protein